MKLTPFGRKVRELRLQVGCRLREMAEFIGCTDAYLSAVEIGKKPIHDDLVSNAIRFFASKNIDASILRSAADQSRGSINVEELNYDERGILAAFARRFPGSSEQDRVKMLTKLNQLFEDA